MSISLLSLKKDYYKRLDIDTKATKKDIKNAFLEKALVWHPDKAPEDKKDEYAQMYLGLQEAYKVLTNDEQRRQYDTALQKTGIELRDEERDTGYHTTNQYQIADESGSKFDAEKFAADFNQNRSVDDQRELEKLQSQYNLDGAINAVDMRKALELRDQETEAIKTQMAQVFHGKGDNFPVDVFNRAFDQMKQKCPTYNPMSVEEYTGGAQNMFSGTSLAEAEDISSLNLSHGFDMHGNNVNDMVTGAASNLDAGMLDIKSLDTGEKYGHEKALTKSEMQRRIDEMMADRTQLAHMKDEDFIIERSEVEQQFSELFAPMEVERLEKAAIDN